MNAKKPENLSRKNSIDSIKFMTSKIKPSNNSKESSSNSKPLNAFGQGKDGRSESLDHEINNTTSNLTDRLNRRAEIVAAVTKRLYSHGKKSLEENKLLPVTSPVLTETVEDSPPRKSSVSSVELLPVMSKIRLQEISRKMLAKRRKIIADTQTDFYESTTRVKHAYTLTDKPKYKDVGVLTDEHEDLTNFGDSATRVRRVKEMATITDKLPRTIVRFKDAMCLTENDGNLSENFSFDSDSENLADLTRSNKEYLTQETSDVGTKVDGTTNTTGIFDNDKILVHTCSNPDRKLKKFKDISCPHRKKLEKLLQEDETKVNSSNKNVISITLPEDLLRITLETSNSLESKITVVEDSNSSSKTEKTFSDSQNQTEFHRTFPCYSSFEKRYPLLRGRGMLFNGQNYGFYTKTNSRFMKTSKLSQRSDIDVNMYSNFKDEFLFDKYPSKYKLSNDEKIFAATHVKNRTIRLQNEFYTQLKRVDDDMKKCPVNAYLKSYTPKCNYDKGHLNALLPLYDDIVSRGRKYYEESLNSFFDVFTDEIKINVSNRMTELKRHNALYNNRGIFLNVLSPKSKTSIEPYTRLNEQIKRC